MKIKSVFSNNQKIPEKYTCDGEDINPAIEISDIPLGTKSIAFIIDDPDAPIGDWVHWIIYNIPVKGNKININENSVPTGAILGMNDFKRLKYGGPCPPSGTHRYFFKAFALNNNLELKEGIRKKELLNAIEGHIIEKAELVGLYSRK